MRQTTSLHSQSLRVRPSHYWSPSLHRKTFRPALNISRFISLLEDATQATTKKRSSPASSSTSDLRRAKRTKLTSDHSASSSVSDEEESEDADETLVDDGYPALSLPRSDIIQESGGLALYHHVSEIEYTTFVPDPSNGIQDQNASPLNWIEQEKKLVETLEKFIGESSEPRTINIGKVILAEHNGRIVAALPKHSPLESIANLHLEWLMLVPAFDQPINLAALDLGNKSEDLLVACITLRSVGRVAIDSSLNVVVLPPTSNDDDDSSLPFRLQLNISVSPVLSNLSTPVTGKTKRAIILIEDAQRRFLEFVFPSTPSSLGESFKGEINIPFFYSILGPAPQLPSKVAEAAMQPEELLPTLLPFQRRSVGWLLDREGRTVTPSGEIVSKPDHSHSVLPPFWDEISFEGQSWYINRLTGLLTSSCPSSHHVMGGILAEEPGLGKTLMCISLVLLHPAPTRNPSLKSWYPMGNMEVKQIKTTLIVTPPALATQWVDELALHAPSLKVFVYEGWSRVSASILAAAGKSRKARKPTGQTRIHGKAKSPAEKRARSRARSKTKSKYVYDSDQENVALSDMEVDAPEEEPEDTPDWCSFINTFDVCITTYNVLRQDLFVARVAPVRPRREDVVYSSAERPRSPLVVCEWYRVIMDEVQMAGGGKIEDMVSLLPRLSSFAVSGTPARSQVADLVHVLKFLRVDGLISSPRIGNRLLKPGFASYFASLFGQYAIRTMKSTVAHELTIPQQTRFLVPIDLGRVERHVYDQALEVALAQLGLDARGVAFTENWEVDSALLRSVIRRLRGICIHPQVGQLQRPGENSLKQGALKTMGEVLEAMRDQNWRNLLDSRHQKVHSLVRFAGLQQHDETDRTRHQHALATLLLAEQEIRQIVDDVKEAIIEHDKKGEVLKQEALARRNARQKSSTPAPDGYFADKGKGRMLGENDESTMESAEDKDISKTPAGEEHASKRRALQLRLREYKVTLHKVKFLQGDVNHVLGGSHSKAEDAAYEAAEEIRHDLLRSYEASATHAMDQLIRDFAAKALTEGSLLIRVPFGEKGGILSFDLMAEANKIIDKLLNEQSRLLWSWRAKIYDLLTRKLSSENGEVDGQEYSRTLDTQGEAEAFFQAFTALLADRREVLIAERTLLAAHDVREKKLRHTKAARKATAASLQANVAVPEDVELQPEHEVLHKTLSEERKGLIKRFQGRAIKSIIFDLNAVAARIPGDNDPEKIIAKKCATDLRQLVNEQSSLMDKLEGDLNQFRKAFNERILYFRQLQELSDSVVEVTWQGSVTDAMQACKSDQSELDGSINTNKARLRYLNHHLTKNAEEGTVDEDEGTCILCRCELVRGFITPCAHVFCEDCLQAWMLRSAKQACPVCRVVINPQQMQRFSVQGDKNDSPPPQLVNAEMIPKSCRQIAYSIIEPDLFEDIQGMESRGSYGNKIQTLIRHLLYLQMVDPEAKSIVFSAWADSLHIIEHALTTNDIGFLRIDQNSKKESAAKRFKIDPAISVLLLHGERENAGLNLTCASRVFLVESVVHHGFELQAIARIDRMSQQRETEVYCYFAEDTVERNILDLAAKQGLSLYTKDNSAGTLDVSSFAQDGTITKMSAAMRKQNPKFQRGDFVLKTEDMLAILFPHMFEELEFLLPENALEGSQSQESGRSQETIRPRRPVQVNAVAGPSRIPL